MGAFPRPIFGEVTRTRDGSDDGLERIIPRGHLLEFPCLYFCNQIRPRGLDPFTMNLLLRNNVTPSPYSWWAILLGLLGLTLGAFAAPETAPRFNILFLVADDMGLQLGCYGDALARTPEMDRLATQSTRFETAYVSQSSCSSSRSTMLTGLFPHQNGQLGLANRGYTMRPGIRTLPTMLHTAGYRTGIIGKLHVNPEEDFPFDFADTRIRATREVKRVSEQAAEFWNDDAEDPWFLMVNYFDPHVEFIDQVDGLPEHPYTAGDVAAFPFQGIDTPAQRAHIAGFYNGIARVDAGVGFILRKLEASGQAERTVVFLIGDNGPPFVRAKTAGTAPAFHVPLIVRWPGVTAGAVSPALVSAADLVPTFRALAGLSADGSLPGRSLVPVLKEASFPHRQYLFAEHTAHRVDMYFPQRTVRDQQFKLTLNLMDERSFGIEVDGDPAESILEDPEWAGTRAQTALQFLLNPPTEELYDLSRDPHEFENLSAQPEYQQTLVRLRTALQVWRETTGDPLLDPHLSAAEKTSHLAAGSPAW